MKMENYYQFAKVMLKIEHSGDELFRMIDDEISYYASEKSRADCMARFVPSENPQVPEKAVRTNVLNNEIVYLKDQRMYLADKEGRYVVSMSVGQKDIRVDYREAADSLKKVLRWLMKWLIIKSAEENGLAFIHASAVNFNGKNIIFSGDSNCGKSSTLMRFVEKGATAISDDSVISDGEYIFPFTLKTRVDEDFGKRFNIDSELFDIGKYMDHKERYKGADLLVFLRIWNNSTSEIRPMEYNKALLSLIRIYRKEIPFLWSSLDNVDGTKLIFKTYGRLLENTKCVEFYAGSNEEEVREKLLAFVNDQ